MAESSRQQLLSLVPVGLQNASTARVIWRDGQKWSEGEVAGQLVELFNAGLVERRKRMTASGFQWLWFRGE